MSDLLTRKPWRLGRDPDDESKIAVFAVLEHGGRKLVSGGHKNRAAAERWIRYHATGDHGESDESGA